MSILHSDEVETARQVVERWAARMSLPLLDLPDACLQAVLRCCAASGDQRSVCSAARAHSRLHQAAVAALGSVTTCLREQQQLDSVLLYLGKHGQHVDTLDLSGSPAGQAVLRQLPPNLQLSSLQLNDMCLQPGQGLLLGAAGSSALKQLRLRECRLGQGSAAALAAALLQLPAGLEHLSISLDTLDVNDARSFQFPPAALQQLQRLTHLELARFGVQGPDTAGPLAAGWPSLRPLQALTRLVHLRLELWGGNSISASMLSGTHHLTHLELLGGSCEPAALAGKTQLQHLTMRSCDISGGAAGEAELLSYLQHVQQLTHLELTRNDWLARREAGNTPPAAAFAALTASSMLQHLDIGSCELPAGVWQHLFPAGRQLPHLKYLDNTSAMQPDGHAAPAPEGSLLVSCCPGLQHLSMRGVQYSAELLAPLTGLSGLHTLHLATNTALGSTAAGVVQAVCQLTGLRSLWMFFPGMLQPELVLQLTQLKQLTSLGCTLVGLDRQLLTPGSGGPGREPVWRQVLRLLLNHSDPQVARQAAAGLAE